MKTAPLLVAVATLALGSLAAADAAWLPTQIVDAERLQTLVSVEDAQYDGTTVRGRVVNRSDAMLEDVDLLIEDSFLWKDEFHPGPDNPGRATTAAIPGPIPPHAAVPFSVELGPRPPRRDGSFVTNVQVLSLVRRDAPGVLSQSQ